MCYMGASRTFRLSTAIMVAVALPMVMGIAEAQVVAQPASLVFHTLDERQPVTLRHGDGALSPTLVNNWHLFAGERSYTHMIRISRTGDGLLVGPSETAEVGSYLLVINTKRGPAQIDIQMPLSGHKSIIEEKAEELGVGVDVVREELGFSQRIERDGIRLNLAPRYTVGEALQVEVPGSGVGRRSVWKINGEVVLEGIGRNKLTHMLTEAGDLELVYEEWQGTRLESRAAARTEVAARPPIHFETQVNTLVTFQGPGGYQSYAWYVDGDPCCHTQNKEHMFEAAGTYYLTCVSSEPLRSDLVETREDVFLVVVH